MTRLDSDIDSVACGGQDFTLRVDAAEFRDCDVYLWRWDGAIRVESFTTACFQSGSIGNVDVIETYIGGAWTAVQQGAEFR